jgi:type II secretory pathway pseudopilin PulG
MKNYKGVTLIALVITVIVLLIIASITINYGVSTLHEVANNKIESELSMVQEAVMQQYALAKSKDELGMIATTISANTALEEDTSRPQSLLGTRIANVSTITNIGFETPLINYNTTNQSNLTYEQYYYQLNADDLKSLGIEKDSDETASDDTTVKELKYIVNYSTGEIFDVGNGTYYNSDSKNGDEPVYITGTTQEDGTQTTYDFNDD